jgi:hypothetical protein
MQLEASALIFRSVVMCRDWSIDEIGYPQKPDPLLAGSGGGSEVQLA